MKKLLFVCLLVPILIIKKAYSQDITVPDSILKEISTKLIIEKEDTFHLKVIYPSNYNSSRKYPLLLALSGGNQSEAIVNYCYAAWFRRPEFKNYLIILPVNTKQKSLNNYPEPEIKKLFKIIKSKFTVNADKWEIAGTSNGGMATFNFIAVQPKLFCKAYVIPGKIKETLKIDNSWKHLKVKLAYGSDDSADWIKAAKETETILKNKVNYVQVHVLENAGHILPIGYDLSSVYSWKLVK